MNENISNKVKELCHKKGMTIRQLSQKMNVAPESLSRAINGNPKLSTIRKISEVLGVSITDLFERNEDELQAIIVYAGATHTATSKQELKRIVDAL